MTNGAYLVDDVDLTVGSGVEPQGLRFDRYYSSAQRNLDIAGLGRGWSHNYAWRAATRSPTDIDMQRCDSDAVLPTLIAARVARDILALDNQASARSWMIACIATTWAADQQINTRADINTGSRTLEFIKKPDGTYQAPGGIKATLDPLNGNAFNLNFRFGNTYFFRSDGLLGGVIDVFGNTLHAAYDSSSNLLTTITDSNNRSLSFSYTGTRLTSVTAGSHSVSFAWDAFAGTLSVKDPEGKTKTYYENSDFEITKVVDARDRTIIENDYDSEKKVYQQRTFGDTARPYAIGIAPGVGVETDPKGNKEWTYTDLRGRTIYKVDRDNNVTTSTYDGVDRLVFLTTPKNETTKYAYYPSHDLQQVTDPNGKTMTITLDAYLRPQTVVDFASLTTSYEYLNLSSTPPTGPVNFTTQPQSQTVSAGQSITLSATAGGAPPIRYQWYVNGSSIAGAISSTYRIASAQTTDAGSYYVKATNDYGSASSNTAVVAVNPINGPVITVQPLGALLNPGNSYTLTVTATSTDGASITYQWHYIDGNSTDTPISGATSTSYTIPSVKISDAGTYYVVVSSGGLSTTSATAIISVSGQNPDNLIPPSIATQPQANQRLRTGDELNLSVIATGSPTLSYQWYRLVHDTKTGTDTDSLIIGAIDANYYIPVANTTDSGTYFVTVSNPKGKVNSALAVVTVENVKPGVPPRYQEASIPTPTLLPLKITRPGGIITSYLYDSQGRLYQYHDSAYDSGQYDTYNYDAYGTPKTISHPDNTTDTYTYDTSGYGDLKVWKDRLGLETDYEYNNRHQPIKVTVKPAGLDPIVTQTHYDDAGDVDSTTDASGRVTSTEHDASGHLLTVKKGAAQVAVLTNDYATDPRTLLHSSTDALKNATIYDYTASNLLYSVKDPLSHLTTFKYNANQQIEKIFTPKLFTTQTDYDPLGRVQTITDAESRTTGYTYDGNGRTTTLKNRNGKTFNWSYDDANRTTTLSTPLKMKTTTVANTRGLPDSVTLPSTHKTSFDTYDTLGRLKQKSDGVATTTYTYYNNGQLWQVTENNVTTTRVYDPAHRLQSYSDGYGHTFSYDYYPSGELKTLTYPGGNKVNYEYDDFGRLWHVTDWANRLTTYTYDNASRLYTITRPNGTTRFYGWDAAGQLKYLKDYDRNNALLFFVSMDYDADGRIQKHLLLPAAAPSAQPADSIQYDDDNRVSIWNNQNVTYDDDGNMTNGPLPSGTATTLGAYGYDARNRLTTFTGSSSASTYTYNPDGLRVQITDADTTTFVVDPNAALSRTLLRIKGGVTTYYVYGLGLLYEDNGSATKYYHNDLVGSTVALSDANGAVTDRWAYSPYGQETRLLGSTDTPFRYKGEFGVQTDPNGLLHMRARYYNPRIMRFLNADPIKFDGGSNWYAYCGNNPVSNIDPDGLYFSPVHYAFTFVAAYNSGFSIGQAHTLAWGAVAADFTPGSQGADARHTAGHAMGGLKEDGTLETRTEAISEYHNYVSEQMDMASSRVRHTFPVLNTAGLETDALAGAVHATQDSLASGHNFKDFGHDLSMEEILSHALGDLGPKTIGDSLALYTVTKARIDEFLNSLSPADRTRFQRK